MLAMLSAKRRLRVAPRGSGPAPRSAPLTRSDPRHCRRSAAIGLHRGWSRTMDQMNDDAWIAAREQAIEKMWLEPMPGCSQPAELDEGELPY